MNKKHLINEFLRSLRNRGLKADTVYQAEKSLDDLFVFLADSKRTSDVRQVVAADLEDFLLYLDERPSPRRDNDTLSPITKNRIVCNVKKFFAYLALNDYIMKDVSETLGYFKVTDMVPRYVLSKEEIMRFLDVIDRTTTTGRRDDCLFRLFYHTGMRRAELMGLTTADVDFESGVVFVTGKFSKKRAIPLGRTIADILKNYILDVRPRLLRCNLAEERLFVSQVGNPLSSGMIYVQMKKYAQKAGIVKNVCLHSLRHTFATHLLNEGASIRHVQEILGHESLETTQIYTRVSVRGLREVYDRTHPRAITGGPRMKD